MEGITEINKDDYYINLKSALMLLTFENIAISKHYQ